ncbi:hypothetical protein CEH05_20585 (plasmid) [Halobacillus halophilus]|nr:hypothetical protein CEH05_20585 [Halobacillus halophilus]
MKIGKIVKRSERPVRSALKRLEESGVLLSTNEKPKTYAINPKYHLVGKLGGRKKERFIKLFKSKAKELLDRLTLSEAGCVYKILKKKPYFHYETFILCGNPNEENPELYEELSQRDLVRKLNHNENELVKIISKLRSKGILLKTESSYITSHYVHPDLMFTENPTKVTTRKRSGICSNVTRYVAKLEQRNGQQVKKRRGVDNIPPREKTNNDNQRTKKSRRSSVT